MLQSDEFKLIGSSSQLFPAYVRTCCRSFYDGTDTDVLEAYRHQAFKFIQSRTKEIDHYAFVKKHQQLIQIWNPEALIAMIEGEHKKDLVLCVAKRDTHGKPKAMCLHCKIAGEILRKCRDDKIQERYICR
jgi:hypothetical protein